MSIRPLENELQKKAESELNEDPDRIATDLKHILEWLQKQPHLNVRTDDQWLIAFLRGCKFSLQRVKEKLDYFHTIRTLLPEFFSNRDPFSPEIQEILKVGVLFPLPKTNNPAEARIFLIRYKACDPDKISVINVMKMFLMFLDVLMLEDDNSTVAGIYLWADYEGFPLNYMMQYTPGFLRKSLLCIQSAYPLRIKGMYCTNPPALFETIYNLCRSFLSDKLKSRLHLYTNSDQTYKDFPQSVLPKEFGGDGGSLDEIAAQWKTKIESYRDWFLEDANYCSDENLRLGKAKTSAGLFGMEGTFRKLTVD